MKKKKKKVSFTCKDTEDIFGPIIIINSFNDFRAVIFWGVGLIPLVSIICSLILDIIPRK